MSEPQSSELRYRAALGRAGPVVPPLAPAPPAKRKVTRITVEMPPPAKRKPWRGRVRVKPALTQEQVLTKAVASTEKLTPNERQLLRGYRLSVGGPAAERERTQIEQEVRRR